MVKKIILLMIAGISLYCTLVYADSEICEARFFEVAINQADGRKTNLISDDDVAVLAQLSNSAIVWTGDTTVIVKAIVDKYLAADITSLAEVENPYSVEAVQRLKLLNSYRGQFYTSEPYTGLFWYREDLEGKKQTGVDDEGQPVMVHIVKRTKWSCENVD